MTPVDCSLLGSQDSKHMACLVCPDIYFGAKWSGVGIFLGRKLRVKLQHHRFYPIGRIDSQTVCTKKACVCALRGSNSLWSLDCSPPGSPVHRIFRARILEWVPISYSSGSSQPRDQTRLSYIFCIGKWISTKKDIPVTEKLKLFCTSHCPSVPSRTWPSPSLRTLLSTSSSN